MKLFRPIISSLSRWIDVVANAVVNFIGRFAQVRAVALIEGQDGAFSLRKGGKGAAFAPVPMQRPVDEKGSMDSALHAGATSLKGSRTEIILQPSRFVFRQIELPSRASEFLDGVVRSQIDRLTPWSVNEAAFGWSKPTDIGNDKIAVTVAATSRSMIMPYVQAVAGFAPHSIVVSAASDGAEGILASITVLEQKGRSAFNPHTVRRALIALLLITILAAGGSVGTAMIVADNLAAQQDDLVRRLAERRTALRTALDAESDSALSRLERRKHENLSSVIVIDALSQVLPDHTFVTELRIEANKIQVIGLTRDAPSLIKLFEQSSHFTHATFFAPTTRSPSDPGDRFHIEARIQPATVPRT